MATGKKKLPLNFGFRPLIRETVLGYMTWSLLHALPPMIWFYPLNELEITGYEAFAIVLLGPILFVWPVRPLIQSRWGMALLRIAAVISIGSFQADRTLHRLVILAAGNFCNVMIFVASLWSSSQYQRCLTFWGQVLGFFAVLSSRIWLVSFHPAWWTEESNSIVIAICIIAVLDKIVSGDDGLEEVPSKESEEDVISAWPVVGVSFGCFLYIKYALFGEVSLICRWIVAGYPDAEPAPNPWGAVVLLSLAAGVCCCSLSFTNGLVWWLVGAGALAELLYFTSYQGMVGGLVFAVYLMAIWPSLVDRVTRCPPARTLTLSMAVFIACVLFNVWTVAYNFVPGGEYTREHTDWLLAFVAAFLGLGMYVGSNIETSHTSQSESQGIMPDGKVIMLLGLIVISGLGGFSFRYNPDIYNHPEKVHPKADFTAAIWTYHFGYDNVGWPSLERTAYLLNESGADVITLLESDASKPFLGNNDLGMWLGERLGMYVDFGPSTRDHTWGNLILSKYPIIKSTHHLLPSPKGELAPAITATVNMTGHLVDFVTTHMGNDRDRLDRKLQANYLATHLKMAVNPVVFLGYVTSAPKSRDYNTLTQKGKVKDIDETDTERWCEYIMYRGLMRLGYARISHGGLSDTEMQMARFRIPKTPGNFQDHDKMTADSKKADRDVVKHFSRAFGSYEVGHHYATDHHYHMSTPTYFLPN